MLLTNKWQDLQRVQTWLQNEGSLNLLWLGLSLLFGLGILWNIAGVVIYSVDQEILPSLEDKPMKATYQMHKDVILNAPYFGVYVNQVDQTISLSPLSEQIVGIMFSKDPFASQVILRTEDGFDKVYHIEDTIKPGVVIRSIHPDSIIILNQGRLEKLGIKAERLQFEPAPGPLNLERTH